MGGRNLCNCRSKIKRTEEPPFPYSKPFGINPSFCGAFGISIFFAEMAFLFSYNLFINVYLGIARKIGPNV